MITITDLHKSFRKTEAVAGLTLEVPCEGSNNPAVLSDRSFGVRLEPRKR